MPVTDLGSTEEHGSCYGGYHMAKTIIKREETYQQVRQPLILIKGLVVGCWRIVIDGKRECVGLSWLAAKCLEAKSIRDDQHHSQPKCMRVAIV
jgi:hypothetical protein